MNKTREQLFIELIKKAAIFSLRKCRCNIMFDVTTVKFKVHDKINYHRTHIINPKTNKFYVLCERCRTKQQEFKEKNRKHAREVNKIYISKPENKERHKAYQQTERYKKGRREYNKAMTWENYGRIENVRCWHLDHKVPAFYKENEDDEITMNIIIKRSHYTNFQPMWEDENISKGNKYMGKVFKNKT